MCFHHFGFWFGDFGQYNPNIHFRVVKTVIFKTNTQSMTGTSLQLTGRPNNDVEEAFVPLFLRITVWTSRALCVTPAQLRRKSGRWRLAVSRPLVKLQRLMVFIASALCVSAYILDFLSEKQYRVRVGKTALSAAICTIEGCLLILSYNLGVWIGSQKLKNTVSILQEINKITTGIKRSSQYSKVKHVLLILYTTWQCTCYLFVFIVEIIYPNVQKNILVASLYAVVGYLAIAVTILQLEWSLTLVEICSTLKLVNDELEHLLKNIATAPQFRNANSDIRRLSISYDSICEMLRQVDNGPFLLFYFFLVSLYSLITPYNVIATLVKHPLQEFWALAIQINWIVLHFSHLATMVEPCHWLQKQKERTRHLLIGLACQAGRCGLNPALLALFLQQTQIFHFPLGPCGIFTFSRRLVTSFIGGISTYLIIIVQFQAVSENI